MTRYEILFNYRQAIRQADKLDEVAKKLEKLQADKLGNTIGTLKNAWRSDNSQQYYNKAARVQDEIRVTAGNVKQIARAIRTTAEAVKQAELRALEIAKHRSYH
jgi:uncharacterized protein YukE